MSDTPRPVALLIMDGWGHREETDSNAIAAANKPHWDALCKSSATSIIETSGINVGLPEGQMGNSEVGHLNLGSGRVVYQELTRIGSAIDDGSFDKNPALISAIDTAVKHNAAVHLMGLLSPGGVHSHEDHIAAAISLAVARGATQVYLHAMLDGRDVPPRSAAASIEKMEALFEQLGTGRIASLCGRYYAMDRDKRWDRVVRAFNLYTLGESKHEAKTAAAALEESYRDDKSDEFVEPVRIGAKAAIKDNDAVIFMNFRADRSRELTEAFSSASFEGFERQSQPELSSFTCLTQYHEDFDVAVAYPPDSLPNVLGEYLADLGKTQLRIAETEKYAHVTFFFNGGREQPFEGEERILVPSPKVATYDLQPEMSAPKVADQLVEAIHSSKFDTIICNFANADMVGHTGNFDAAVKAIEALDECIGKVAEALKAVGGELLITADHGNAEKMMDHETGQAHTAHTTFQVPLLYMGRPASLQSGGTLSDIAPTLLTLMGVTIPEEMTGRSLVKFD